ncbi:hypothetical protein ACH5RR_025985, partial [Cinchona calisaya]
ISSIEQNCYSSKSRYTSRKSLKLIDMSVCVKDAKRMMHNAVRGCCKKIHYG